ncbi:MAG TPA: hypothetical protein VHR43_08645 [Gemmatimonadales bacterium]|nr:hypothetical protein [Gemmatimonadales bacterium]
MFAVLAGNEWSDSAPPTDRGGSDRSGFAGALILLLVAGLSVGLLYGFSSTFGWPRDRTLWVGLGGALGLLTLLRPWWFWDNYRARWLRNLIGDEPTAGLYLAVAAAMIWVGLFTQWTFGRR